MEDTNILEAPQYQDDLDGRFLLFDIGESLYGIGLKHIIEIINIQNNQHITHLPNVPAYIKGIINLRGKVIPVMDVRIKLNMEERAYDDKTCIVVSEILDMQIGLIVDSVSEVFTADPSKLSKPPKFGDNSARYLASVIEDNEKIILNLDCIKFFQADLDNYVNMEEL